MFAMTDRYEIHAPRDAGELGQLLDILAVVFNFPREGSDAFADRVGHDRFRIVRDRDRLVGGLATVPMGQWLGGRSVPMTGIVAVGIDPAARGSGAASALMSSVMRELHAARHPLSGLYPATQTLYRAAGYEQAGDRYKIELMLRRMRTGTRALDLREAGEGDHAIVEQLYTRDAAQHNGPLDRGPYIWARVRTPRGETTRTFLVERDGTAEGYVILRYDRADKVAYDVQVTDLVATTPDAGRRLLSLLADHRSMAERAILWRPPADPLLALLPEQHYHVSLDIHWMTRIAHVASALTARGYAPSVRGTVHLRVHDDVLPENSGKYVLHVEDCKATVERGGDGRIELDVRGLAMMYTGFRSPAGVAATGLLSGPTEDLAIAAGIFAGGAPWMSDMF